MWRLSLVVSLGVISGCGAAMAANYVPRQRATECVAHCTGLDMELSAVVVIANMTGCVCQPAGSSPPGPRTTSATVAGSATAAAGAAIALATSSAEATRPKR